jgi:Ser/Thr protein kinase RdoA (MazF antagonist)
LRVGGHEPVTVRRVGAGYGLASIVARVDVGDDSFAVKLCDGAAARAEMHAYTQLLPATRGLRRPEFVAADSDGDAADVDRGVVVTRFVDGTQGDVLAGCDPEIARELTRMVARLHAAWWERSDHRLVPIDVERLRPLTSDEVERCVRDHGDVLSPAGAALLHDLTERLGDAAERLAAQPVTVLHCDLHLDNVLVHEDGPVLLDWAGPRCGPAAIDVARCLVEFTAGAADDDECRSLLDVYADEVRRHGIDEPPGFRGAVRAALVAGVAPSVRWAVRQNLPPASRERRLFRFGLRRIDALLAG